MSFLGLASTNSERQSILKEGGNSSYDGKDAASQKILKEKLAIEGDAIYSRGTSTVRSIGNVATVLLIEGALIRIILGSFDLGSDDEAFPEVFSAVSITCSCVWLFTVIMLWIPMFECGRPPKNRNELDGYDYPSCICYGSSHCSHCVCCKRTFKLGEHEETCCRWPIRRLKNWSVLRAPQRFRRPHGQVEIAIFIALLTSVIALIVDVLTLRHYYKFSVYCPYDGATPNAVPVDGVPSPKCLFSSFDGALVLLLLVHSITILVFCILCHIRLCGSRVTDHSFLEQLVEIEEAISADPSNKSLLDNP